MPSIVDQQFGISLVTGRWWATLPSVVPRPVDPRHVTQTSYRVAVSMRGEPFLLYGSDASGCSSSVSSRFSMGRHAHHLFGQYESTQMHTADWLESVPPVSISASWIAPPLFPCHEVRHMELEFHQLAFSTSFR